MSFGQVESLDSRGDLSGRLVLVAAYSVALCVQISRILSTHLSYIGDGGFGG